jgi:Retinal pigment epithelial membrane protein
LSVLRRRRHINVNDVNINFEDWIMDDMDEIKEWKNAVVKGKIPSFVRGTLVRNGPSFWTGPNSIRTCLMVLLNGLPIAFVTMTTTIIMLPRWHWCYSETYI